MKMKPASYSHGHAAGKSGQELGLQNELALLNCIKMQGWVREFEAALITGMSLYMVCVVSRRLANNGQIFREQCKNRKSDKTKRQKRNRLEIFDGNTGFFLRLTAIGANRVGGKSGKDISIPATWRHHAMAIQTLHFLPRNEKYGFETEASMRHRKISGKIPDGRLLTYDCLKTHFEQERTHKSGKAMYKQAEAIAKKAAAGTHCYLAYPYPKEISEGINHELRLTNAIRKLWGDSNTSLITLIRCHYNSLIEYTNMHVSKFEMITLPSKTSTGKYYQNGLNRYIGFSWDITENRQCDGTRTVDAILWLGDEVKFQGTFYEGLTIFDNHLLKDENGDLATEMESDQIGFDEFIRAQQDMLMKNSESSLLEGIQKKHLEMLQTVLL